MQILDQFASAFIVRSGIWLVCAAVIGMALAGNTALAAEAGETQSRASHFKLDNGMEVVVIPDHRAPVATHMVWYRVGSGDEPPGTSGIAHFLEHLMFKGTEEIPPGQFSKIIARNGGQDNAFTSYDATAYFQRVAKDRLPLVMKMEADRMANLRLEEKDVLTERKVILEERRSRVDNDPSAILTEQMMAALYQSHPYGTPIIGWEHEMQELSSQDALDFYKHFYAPDNAILVVAGDVTPEEVKKLAKETYGKLPAHAGIKTRVRPQEPKHYAALRVHLEDPRAGQPMVQRYYLAPSYTTSTQGDAEALDILIRIVGGGSNSRLYKKLVVKENKAVSVGAWYSGNGLDSSRIGLYAVAGGNDIIQEAEKAMDQVLEEVRKNGVTQAELDRARNKILADNIYAADSQTKLARRYGWALSNGQTVEDVDAWPERMKKVTTKDLQRVAKKYLTPNNSVTGVLVPRRGESKKAADAGESKKS